ncbi:MAG: DUF6390 family protein [Candidatus Micrarchaeota archaeon]
MDGTELAALYAFPPNALGYCGASTFRNALRSFLRGRSDLGRLEAEMRKFPVHQAYLSLIAKENDRSPFDLEVVRAFWTGNPLLWNVSREAFKGFIARDLFHGTRKKHAQQLAHDLPEGLLPHHSLNPLYINFVSNKVDRSIKSIDSCCVTWGEILSVTGRFADVLRYGISWEGILTVKPRLEVVDLEREGVRLVPDLKEGDWVSVHWGMAVEKLHAKDRRSLERYTRMNLDALNSVRWLPPMCESRASRPISSQYKALRGRA